MTITLHKLHSSNLFKSFPHLHPSPLSLSALRKIIITQHPTTGDKKVHSGMAQLGKHNKETSYQPSYPARAAPSSQHVYGNMSSLKEKQHKISYQPASPEFPFVHGQPHGCWKHSSSHFRFNLGSVTYAHLCLHLLLNDTQARRSKRENDGIWLHSKEPLWNISCSVTFKSLTKLLRIMELRGLEKTFNIIKFNY